MNPILNDMPMPIETPRLILRNVLPGDGATLHEMKAETLQQLKKWMPWAKDDNTAEDDEIVARRNHARFILREDMMMLGFEKDGGRCVVSTGLHRFDWESRTFEIGYWVRASAQGRGYASEAANALARYAFGQLNARKVTICHAGGNDASRRIIEKLGFDKEGVFRQAEILPDGEITDRHWYARFNPEGLPDLKVTWRQNNVH